MFLSLGTLVCEKVCRKHALSTRSFFVVKLLPKNDRFGSVYNAVQLTRICKLKISNSISLSLQDDIVLVEHKNDKAERKSAKNIALACAITSYGRIMILKKILELNEACLYADTDSVIFLHTGGPIPFEPSAGVAGDFVEERTHLRLTEYLALGTFAEKRAILTRSCTITFCVKLFLTMQVRFGSHRYAVHLARFCKLKTFFLQDLKRIA